ncbi:MAG: hypothetical protein JSS91_13105 [Bacteroidetes bacterium]|nr:hypothetical protein [Bacteroidota bacterium]
MKLIYCLFIFTAFCVLSFSLEKNAQATETVPPAYKNTAGNSTFTSPLSTSARTYQLLIHSSQLTGFVGKNLTGISWRNPANASSNWPAADVNISNYRIFLSGSVDPANRSLVRFSDNVVGPQIQVRSGSLFIPAGSYTFGSSPNAYGPEITFDIPYAYTGGNLLIELRQSGFTGTSRSQDGLSSSSTPNYGTDFSACWKSTDTATVAPTNGNFAIVQISTQQTNLNLNLTAFIEGRYNNSTNSMVSDTAKVFLHNTFSPFAVVDSAVSVLGSNGNGNFIFNEALNAVNYYIVLVHRNSIETWSSTGQSFTAGNLSYDFSGSAAQAYGSNMIQVDLSPVRYAVYSADVTRDGTVDLTDASLIDNDAFNFTAGYVLTDINGDLVVDVSDAVFADNNAFNFVGKVTP